MVKLISLAIVLVAGASAQNSVFRADGLTQQNETNRRLRDQDESDDLRRRDRGRVASREDGANRRQREHSECHCDGHRRHGNGEETDRRADVHAGHGASGRHTLHDRNGGNHHRSHDERSHPHDEGQNGTERDHVFHGHDSADHRSRERNGTHRIDHHSRHDGDGTDEIDRHFRLHERNETHHRADRHDHQFHERNGSDHRWSHEHNGTHRANGRDHQSHEHNSTDRHQFHEHNGTDRHPFHEHNGTDHHQPHGQNGTDHHQSHHQSRERDGTSHHWSRENHDIHHDMNHTDTSHRHHAHCNCDRSDLLHSADGHHRHSEHNRADHHYQRHAHNGTDHGVVQISMDLALQNPFVFVNHSNSRSAVAQGIAAVTGVDVTDVDATLSVSRRLNVHVRNLQTTANVYAEVVVPDSVEATSLASEVSAMSPEVITSTLNSVLEEADVPVVEVLAVEATVATTQGQFSSEQAPTQAPFSSDSGTEFTDEASCSSMSSASVIFLLASTSQLVMV